MAAVHPALAPHVRSIVVYDVAFAGPGVHIGMPSTGLTFVLPLDEPLAVAWEGEPGTRTVGWTSVSGLHTTAAAVHHGDHQRGIQRSEEHTSELQSRRDLVCRLLLEKKK